jgi:uncharacterized protein YcfL
MYKYLLLILSVLMLSACKNQNEKIVNNDTVSYSEDAQKDRLFIKKVKQSLLEQDSVATIQPVAIKSQNQDTNTKGVSYQLKPFDNVFIENGVNIHYVESNEYKMLVTQPNDDFHYKIDNDTLSLSLDNNWYDDTHVIEITLYAPSLQSVALKGNSVFDAQKITSSDFAVSNGGYGNIMIKNLEVKNLKWKNQGLSKTEVHGFADKVELDSSSMSEFNWSKLVINNLNIRMTGLGNGHFNVKKNVQGVIGGNSSVSIVGGANLENLKCVGSAEVNKKPLIQSQLNSLSQG